MDDDFNVEAIARQRKEEAERVRRAQQEQMEKDPELRAILEETRRVQQDTLASTENSVRAIHETVGVADRTTETLRAQGEQLDRIEGKAEDADVNATDSYKSAKDIEKHSGWLPFSITGMFKGGKKKSEDRALKSEMRTLDKKQVRLEAIAERESAAAQTVTPEEAEAEMARRRALATAAAGGDATEEAITRNLDEISTGLDQIQKRAGEMGSELERQNVTMRRIEALNEHTDYTLQSADRKVKRRL